MYSGEGGGCCVDFFLSFFIFFAGGEDISPSDKSEDFFLLFNFLVDFFFSGLLLFSFPLDLPFLSFSGLFDIRLFDPLLFSGVTCLEAELYVPYFSGLLETFLSASSFCLMLFLNASSFLLNSLFDLDRSARFLSFILFNV